MRPGLAGLVWAALSCAALPGDTTSRSDWPQFRGRRAAGVAAGQSPPLVWDASTGNNIRWKTPSPGLGHSSPIVVADCVYVTTARSQNSDPRLRVGLYGDIAPVPDEGQLSWELYCLSKHTGAVLWTRTVHQGTPAIKRHPKATHANSTPASDGTYVVVFLGSEGLHCYDICGNPRWTWKLGTLDSGYYVVPQAQWGFGSSPIIYDNRVIVQCDVQKESFIAAFSICDGRELWRTHRDDVPTWSTPTIYDSGRRTEVVVNGFRHAGGYDPGTGRELWKLGGGGDIPVPTPVVAKNLIFLSSAHGRRRPLCAIRAGATGDITPNDGGPLGDHIAWYEPRDGIYMQTPLVYGDYLYACRDDGVLTCYEARTGKRIYRERLGSGGFTASAVAAGASIYFTSESGTIYVVRAGPDFEILARNDMGEVCMATPAISAGMLIVRGKSHVYAIAQPRLAGRGGFRPRAPSGFP